MARVLCPADVLVNTSSTTAKLVSLRCGILTNTNSSSVLEIAGDNQALNYISPEATGRVGMVLKDQYSH